MSIKILTPVVNNPLFIELQFYSLKKYCKGEYEFIVFNDAKDFPHHTNGNDLTLRNQIQLKCKELGIKCINIPNDYQKMYLNYDGCGDSNNFILQYQMQNPDKYLVIDSDMFFINYFDVTKFDNYKCAGVLQYRNTSSKYIFYFWNGLYFFNSKNIPDMHLLSWNKNFEVSSDFGGQTWNWLSRQTKNFPSPEQLRYTTKDYHSDGIYFIKHLWSCSWDLKECPKWVSANLLKFFQNDPRNEKNNFFCEIYDDMILHYRAGGNWRGEGIDFHNNLTKNLYNILMPIYTN